MDRMTSAFWTIIFVLLGTSVFYGVSAELQRRNLHHSAEVTLVNGDVVKLVKLIDGDSLQVAKAGQETVNVRIVGIKSFNVKVEKDVVAPYAQAGLHALEQLLKDKPLRVLLNQPAQDKSGRYLVTLFVDDEDVAIKLIAQGLTLVYTVYPFYNMQAYHHEQVQAQAAKRGLWANRQVAQRAEALIAEWRNRSE